MSNCGLPDGVVHAHSAICYQGGRRDALAEVGAEQIEADALDRAWSVLGWQHLAKFSGMSREWMDQTLTAIVRSTITAALTAAPDDARACVHCEAEVRADGGGDWIHARGLYRCQSGAVAYGHLAHPADVPCRADGPNPCLGASS